MKFGGVNALNALKYRTYENQSFSLSGNTRGVIWVNLCTDLIVVPYPTNLWFVSSLEPYLSIKSTMKSMRILAIWALGYLFNTLYHCIQKCNLHAGAFPSTCFKHMCSWLGKRQLDGNGKKNLISTHNTTKCNPNRLDEYEHDLNNHCSSTPAPESMKASHLHGDEGTRW